MAHRILMGFLGSQWKNLTPQQRVTWEAIAGPANSTPYNSYIASNMNRYRTIGANSPFMLDDHAVPTKTWPAAEVLLPVNFLSLTITGLALAVRINWTIFDIRDNWGIAVHHAWSTPPTPDFQNLVALADLSTADPGSLTITGLEPGLYRTQIATFSHDGRPHFFWIGRQAVVAPAGSPPEHPGPPQPPPPPPIPF